MFSSTIKPLIEESTRDGKRFLAYNFHPGQSRAWISKKRIIAVIAGARSGKTSFGPLWLHREMQLRGPGDYLIAAPSYPLLDKAAGPEVQELFERRLALGKMTHGPLRFTFSDKGCRTLWGKIPTRSPRILFAHADDPESLEAMTCKAGWADECGQKRFKLGSWEAINRRVSIDQGRLLLTTTPYNAGGWLQTLICDPVEACKGQHAEIDLVRFDSTLNPAFPPAEYERAQRDLPRWKFDLFFRGIFTRQPGLIYDSFDLKRHTMAPMKVPESWQRFVGLDFGGVNLAAVFFAEEQDPHGAATGRLIAYREYHPGKRKPSEHVAAILEGEPRIPTCVGGAASEDDWRDRFAEAGLPILKPEVRDVEVGIDSVWSCFARNQLSILSSLTELRDELATYSRELDEAGEPTEKIEAKETYHLLDACRYVVGWMRRDRDGSHDVFGPHPEARTVMSRITGDFAMPGVFAGDDGDDLDSDAVSSGGGMVDWGGM